VVDTAENFDILGTGLGLRLRVKDRLGEQILITAEVVDFSSDMLSRC
jgi:hypothetical protein